MMSHQKLSLRVALLLSVKPRWASKLVDGTKTVEFRRRGPGRDAIGKPMLIYASAPLSQLIGFGGIKDAVRADPSELWGRYAEQGGTEEDDFRAYFSSASLGEALIVSCSRLPHYIGRNLLRTRYGVQPPQSWCWLAATSPLLDLISFF
jgi:predicted transcriptional regulator